MVSDEDVLVLRFMRRSLPLSLDRFLTRFLVFRELLGVYAWDFFVPRIISIVAVLFIKNNQEIPGQIFGTMVGCSLAVLDLAPNCESVFIRIRENGKWAVVYFGRWVLSPEK